MITLDSTKLLLWSGNASTSLERNPTSSLMIRQVEYDFPWGSDWIIVIFILKRKQRWTVKLLPKPLVGNIHNRQSHIQVHFQSHLKQCLPTSGNGLELDHTTTLWLTSRYCGAKQDRGSATLSSNLCHFWLQKTKMVTDKMPNWWLQNSRQTNRWGRGGYVHFLDTVYG